MTPIQPDNLDTSQDFSAAPGIPAALSGKAAQTDMDQAQADITTLQGDVAGKADASGAWVVEHYDLKASTDSNDVSPVAIVTIDVAKEYLLVMDVAPGAPEGTPTLNSVVHIAPAMDGTGLFQPTTRVQINDSSHGEFDYENQIWRLAAGTVVGGSDTPGTNVALPSATPGGSQFEVNLSAGEIRRLFTDNGLADVAVIVLSRTRA